MTAVEASAMEQDEGTLNRATFEEFIPEHRRFVQKNREYTQQFSHLYFSRLAELKAPMDAVCLTKWQDSGIKHVSRVLDIEPDVECICVGTLYKEMALKPNFLHDYLKEIESGGDQDEDDDNASNDGEAMIEAQVSYQSKEDHLIIEDESGRMVLEGSALPPQLVTGVVIGVKGRWEKNANFVVDAISVCGIPPQEKVERPINAASGPVYLALVSGLNIGSPKSNPLAIQLLLDFVAGTIGDGATASRIARFVVAGNSIYPTDDIKSKDKIQCHGVADEHNTLVDPMKELDLYLAELSSNCPLDLMPGENDPTNCFLPQQPIHPCLLAYTGKQGTVSFTTNPYQAKINGLTAIGVSGQTVEDIHQYASFESRADILESTLNWRNLAPTAPDTLSVYPFKDTDPFVLEQCPHLYFSGNGPSFGTKFVRGRAGQTCRVVSVPSFVDCPCLVLVDINSEELDTKVVDFVTFAGVQA